MDACGACGGNGSTCSQPMYQWDMAPMSLCSATCGGGKPTFQYSHFRKIKNGFQPNQTNKNILIILLKQRKIPNIAMENPRMCSVNTVHDASRYGYYDLR